MVSMYYVRCYQSSWMQMGSHGAGEDIVQMLFNAKAVVLLSLSRFQPTRNIVEHLTQLEWMWEEFLLKRGLLTTAILVRVRIFWHVSRTYKCVQSLRSLCFQELITTHFVTSLERNNFISCLCWKSEVVVMHGGPTCARKSGIISHPDGHSSCFVWLSWFSSILFHGIKKA